MSNGVVTGARSPDLVRIRVVVQLYLLSKDIEGAPMASSPGKTEQEIAAATIQRNYRGYRGRRQCNGMGIDASSRWIEAVKEAKYRKLITPHARPRLDELGGSEGGGRDEVESLAALSHWKKAAQVVRRAGSDDGDDNNDNDEDDDNDSDINNNGAKQNLSEAQLQEKRRIKLDARRERNKNAKTMDMQYFLEMVDLKHRHGANLRAYHEEWKKSSTAENFFYWLDYGEGRTLDLPDRPRARLEREQVRYLSREERLNYLVKIDDKGRFCWAKNGAIIDTSAAWKDSIHGIVPIGDQTPAYHAPGLSPPSSIRSLSSDASSTVSLHEQRPSSPAPKQVSPAAILGQLMSKPAKKSQWIFVADTSHRLYINMKQRGTFQHSSFLHGARISAAGRISIRGGKVRSISPLSGHYRPPPATFLSFIRSLEQQGADLSHVSVKKSYAVGLGTNVYGRYKKGVQATVKRAKTRVESGFNDVVVVTTRRHTADDATGDDIHHHDDDDDDDGGLDGKGNSAGGGGGGGERVDDLGQSREKLREGKRRSFGQRLLARLKLKKDV
ncbi:MAG: hypothetical protein M1825_000673 [Sarcosagium campestre]|nr:MAG: hypothetical protein M1825_000673 [Sarcosagium campestre]